MRSIGYGWGCFNVRRHRVRGYIPPPGASRRHPPQAGEVQEGRPRLPRRVQPSQNLVELFELAIADVHGAAAFAMIDADGKPERIADAFLERDRVGILHLAAARLLRLSR